MSFEIDTNFQTPPVVAIHMAKIAKHSALYYIPERTYPNIKILEPTPGTGTLVLALQSQFGVGPVKWAPREDFWTCQFNTEPQRFEAVVMNPPFNPIKEMERFVNRAMELTDNIIALLPYNYLVNSERRVSELMDYGLVSITHLPRKTFPGCRVQVAIFELKRGHRGQTVFKRFTW